MAIGQYLGIIGAVVGGIIGGVIGSVYPGVGTAYGAWLGASLGGMAGGIAGQVFYPEKFDLNLPPPPQPHENRFQVSTYGAAVPIVYESARLAGNIIYMSPINNTVVRTSHRQDGVRYYELTQTYTCTFAVAFCEGPVEGISRIWLNSKVFADYRDPAGPYYPSGSTALATANLDTSIALEATYFSIYLGSESQSADANISALITAAENPAYRGICYIVFIDFPIGEFNGLPNVEVEIGSALTVGNVWETTGTPTDSFYSEVYNCRILITPSRSITRCRFEFLANSSHDTKISGASIGLRSGISDDFSGAPSRITFGGSDSVVIVAGTSIWSDWINFSMSPSSTYLVHIYQYIPGAWIYTSRFLGGTGEFYIDINYTDETLLESVSMMGPGYADSEYLKTIEGI